MEPNPTRRRNRGFTLWELIAVIAVMFIGAAIFWPVFSRGTPQPRKSTCQNNLKQIALGFKQYINDFNERYPLVVVTDAATTAGVPPYGWADSLQPYLRNTQVYQCPSDNSDSISATDTTDTPNFCDYWYNANFVVRSKNKAGAVIFTGVSENYLGSSSQTVIAGDGGNTTGVPTGNTTGVPTGNARYNQCGDGSSLSGRNQVCAPQKPGVATYPAAQIHLKGANFAFADGHVKWLRGTNASQSAQVRNNRATQASIGGAVTFSLLNIP